MNEWRFRIIVIALSVWVAVGIVWNIVAYTRVERKPEITVASDYALLPASALSDYVLVAPEWTSESADLDALEDVLYQARSAGQTVRVMLCVPSRIEAVWVCPITAFTRPTSAGQRVESTR